MQINSVPKIKLIQSLWPEAADFSLERRDIGDEYIFLHFISSAEIFLSGKMRKIPPGSCILYDKHSYQKIAAAGVPLVHDWFHITGCLDGITQKYGFEYGKLYTVRDSSAITAVIQKIELETLRAEQFSDFAAALFIEELIINILRQTEHYRENAQIDRITAARFSEIRERLCREYADNWNTQKMAECVNLSTSRFYKLYRDIFGVSPNTDLRKIRIEHAKTLLMQGKYLIREIAEMTGYSNPYHFIRQFREQTGTTPGKYK